MNWKEKNVHGVFHERVQLLREIDAYLCVCVCVIFLGSFQTDFRFHYSASIQIIMELYVKCAQNNETPRMKHYYTDIHIQFPCQSHTSKDRSKGCETYLPNTIR